MTLTASPQRASLAARRAGYTVAVLINIAFLWVVNIWPGWEVLPFLTAETASVIGVVNACIWVNLVFNVVYAIDDNAWIKFFGTLASNVVGIFATLRIWDVFPFDFGDTTVDWAMVTRVVLVVGIAGSVIAMIAAVVTLAKALSRQSSDRP
ncbi:hypothetical protein ACVBEQ_28000, partial [Nakamurella sp. GG22]